MGKLYRPSIGLKVKCRVAITQLGELWGEDAIEAARGSLGALLEKSLIELAELLGCTRRDLRLDHQPALALRIQHPMPDGRTRYEPAANDPEFLIFRSAPDHDRKTRIRGDGAQYSDITLIKRQRRRERQKKPKPKWQSRPFPNGKRPFQSRPFRGK